MKIAIPSTGKNLASPVSDTLGRAPFIIIFDSITEKYDSLKNPGFQIQDGSGLKAVEKIMLSEADVILTKEIGRKAYSVLQKEHVKIQLLNSGGTLKFAIKKYLKSKRSDVLI